MEPGGALIRPKWIAGHFIGISAKPIPVARGLFRTSLLATGVPSAVQGGKRPVYEGKSGINRRGIARRRHGVGDYTQTSLGV